MSIWDTPGTVERLRVLWDEGHSTSEIGRRLGCGKNAVIGKKRRLGLPERPSPIIREYPELAERRKKVRALKRSGHAASTICKMLDISRSQYETAARAPNGRRTRVLLLPGAVTLPPLPSAIMIPLSPEAEMPVAKPVAAKPPQPVSQNRCAWPTNDGILPNGRKGWTFCEEKAVVGKVYCAAHHRQSVGAVRDRTEAA